MRIQYSPSISVLLSVLITVSACQGDAHRMYMDNNSDHPATSQSYKEPAASSTSLAVITDGLSCMHPKEASVETSSATPSPSSSAGGSSMSAQITSMQENKEPEDAKLIAVTANEATDAQVAPAYSPEDHEAWFHEFVNAVENPEVWTWHDIEEVLDKGRSLGYLTRPIGWDDDRYTPLHYAAEEGDLGVVQELIEKHNIPVDIRTERGKRTPLHLAALRGQLAVAEYLINQGAALHAIDKDGSHPLHYAALGVEGKVNTEVVTYLHGKGTDLEIVLKGFNLLHLAIKVGNLSLVKYLLEQCPSLIKQEIDGVTPLAYAEAKQETSIAEAIQEKMDNQSGPCW